MPRKPPQPRHTLARPAFTLVEAVISIVIVGVMFVAALTTVGAAAQGRWVQAEWREADTLARSLLGEIACGGYGATSGAMVSLVVGGAAQDRSAWNEADDYNGLVDSPPTDRTGTVLAGYSSAWRRQVKVVRVAPADPSGVSTGNTDYGLKRITVTVTAPSGKQTVLSALCSRWGCAQQSTPADVVQARAAVVRLRLDAGADIYAGTIIPNNAAVTADPGLVADIAAGGGDVEAASGGLLSGLFKIVVGGGG